MLTSTDFEPAIRLIKRAASTGSASGFERLSQRLRQAQLAASMGFDAGFD